MTKTDENPVTLNFLWRQSKDCHGKGNLGKMLHYLGTLTLLFPTLSSSARPATQCLLHTVPSLLLIQEVLHIL